MDNTRLGKTTLEYIPHDILHPKRVTNRLWTFLIILLIGGLFGTFWYYKRAVIINTPSTIVSVTPPTAPNTPHVDDLETLSNTAIPDFHTIL